ncbi:MAG: winged helix-turn-helix domain-containing protein, partial [Chloroflexia bacterium]|nr:winged helix-turn-helix domain-containing protein [Chloroflexia bacterium]
MRLTQEHARTLLLAAQGLCAPVEQPTTKDAVLAAIRQMGVLQIDTISVVARSPYLVLWSRLGTYEPRWLDELLAERAIFEYWAHALCFLPMGEYGLYRRGMLEPIGPGARARAWIAQQPEVPARVLDRIRSAGPLRSAEFPGVGFRSSGWWDHKPEKVALEQLFLAGELMIARRENFQRVYDLRERVLPGWHDTNLPTAEESQRAFALRAVRALGVAKAGWVPDYYRTAKRGIGALLDALAA